MKKLKQEEEKSRLMTLLYSSVHHEIIDPLENNIQAAVRLIRMAKDSDLRELAQIILVCSKRALLNANDILDKNFYRTVTLSQLIPKARFLSVSMRS